MYFKVVAFHPIMTIFQYILKTNVIFVFQKMDQLKEDNRRLREENGALIRVISKLSK